MTESSQLELCSLTGALIVLCCVGCEIGKQISNYSSNYYNAGQYPLPQTILVRRRAEKNKHWLKLSLQVFLLEALKLTATSFREIK